MSKSEQRTEAIRNAHFTAFLNQAGLCAGCGESVNRYGTAQLGHKIPQGKRWIRKYGAEVIHSPLNMALTCCLRCNGKVDIRNRPLEIAALVAKIKETL